MFVSEMKAFQTEYYVSAFKLIVISFDSTNKFEMASNLLFFVNFKKWNSINEK